MSANQLQLLKHLASIKNENLVVYGEEKHLVKTVNIGSSESFEIHYFEDSSEINEAFFKSNDEKTPLTAEEIAVLELRF